MKKCKLISSDFSFYDYQKGDIFYYNIINHSPYLYPYRIYDIKSKKEVGLFDETEFNLYFIDSKCERIKKLKKLNENR